MADDPCSTSQMVHGTGCRGPAEDARGIRSGERRHRHFNPSMVASEPPHN